MHAAAVAARNIALSAFLPNRVHTSVYSNLKHTCIQFRGKVGRNLDFIMEWEGSDTNEAMMIGQIREIKQN